MTHATQQAAISKTLFIEAYACDDHGDGPTYARCELTPGLIDRLRELRALAEANQLESARVYASPDAWGPSGIEDELRFNQANLVVTPSEFWFTDRPKHADYHVECRAVSFDDLDAMLSSEDAELYSGDDLAYVKDQVEEDREFALA